MENKNAYQAELFSNRLTKNYKQLKKWARKNRVTCYRLYDKDIPEVPLCADLYTLATGHLKYCLRYGWPPFAQNRVRCARIVADFQPRQNRDAMKRRSVATP